MEQMYTAEYALNRLKEGNRKYIGAEVNTGDISQHIRDETSAHGQHPYAIIVACSDSREIPEAIFMSGIGELFTIRVAGNVIADSQLGSIEYAAEHLGVPLTVVLGHTDCGAVGAAMSGAEGGYVGSITTDIRKAIRKEADPCEASRRNVRWQAARIRKAFPEWTEKGTMKTIGALYHISTGEVEWLTD